MSTESTPLFIQFTTDFECAYQAKKKGELLSLTFKDGRIREKTGMGYLFSKITKTYYRVYDWTFGGNSFKAAQKEQFLNLLQRAQNFYETSRVPPNKEFKEFEFKNLDPLILTRFHKIASRISEQMKTSIIKGTSDWISRDIPQMPSPLLECLVKVFSSGIRLDLLAKTANDISNPATFQCRDRKQLITIAQTMDLYPAIKETVDKFDKTYYQFQRYVEKDADGKLKLLKEYDPREPGALYLSPEEQDQVDTYIQAYNQPYLNDMRNIVKVAEFFSKNPDLACRGIPEDYQRRFNEENNSLEIPLNQDGRLVPTKDQLKSAFQIGYDLFKGCPKLNTSASRAFFARMIQYVMSGDRIGYVLKPVDSICFTCKELEKGESFPIEEHGNFPLWSILKGNPNAISGIHKRLKQFLIDLNRKQTFVYQVGNIAYPIGANPETLEAFVTAYHREFENYLQANLPAFVAFVAKFKEKLEKEGVSLGDLERLSDLLKEANPNDYTPEIQAVFERLRPLNIPQLNEKEGTALWRYALLILMLTAESNVTGISPYDINQNLMDNNIAVRLNVALKGIPISNYEKSERTISVKPGTMLYRAVEGPSVPSNQLPLAVTRHPDAPSQEIVPLAWVYHSLEVPEMYRIASEKHATLHNISKIAVSPYTLEILDDLVAALQPKGM